MKTLYGWTGLAFLCAAVLAAGAAFYVEAAGLPRYPPRRVDFAVDKTGQRVERGRRTAQMLCAGCHLDPATGALTGRPLADLPSDLGAIASTNITQDWRHGLGAWTDGEIAYLLRTGVARDGSYSPPWMPKYPLLADEELRDVIAFLRSGDPQVRAVAVPNPVSAYSFLAKMLVRTSFRPLPYPVHPIVAPAASDPVAYGRYLATAKLGCHWCHSRDHAQVDALQPERSRGFMGGGEAMAGHAGQVVYASNLTPDVATGLGAWTEEQFRRALRTGLRPDGRALQRPMAPRPELTDQEVHAVWAYLRSLPPLENAVPAPPPPLTSGAR